MDELERGRGCFGRQAWGDAFAALSAADRQAPLGPEDLELLATTAFLSGRDGESTEAWTRAYQGFLERGEAERAARCAFWLGFRLLNRGEGARGSGWLARAGRVLDEAQRDGVGRGYLVLPGAIRSLEEGDAATAYASFGEVAKSAERFHDRDLLAMARLGRGRSLIRLGDPAQGVSLLDEVMIEVTAGEVSPIVVGDIYCAVILACRETFDLRRSREWTAALSRWCESQPDLVPYRGQCLVHRAEILQLHGAWPDAMEQARRARELLSDPGQPAVGDAFYQQAELHRLRGEFDKAEEAYRQASQWGRSPQPGLALLRLAQGHVESAKGSIRRVLDEAQYRATRSRLLPAFVEVELAAGDVEAAAKGADELSEIAAELGAPLLQALAAQARGATLLERDPREALAELRKAWAAWQKLEAPYEAARVRVFIGLACRRLGDEDGAEMELDAARWVFRELGAAPDLARVEELTRRSESGAPGGLTVREIEVLRLVAAGKTNREIASELVISEHTVARHLQNMFAKLDVSSRAAATAFAFEHGLA